MSYPVLKLIVRGMLLASVAVLVAARVVDYTTALAVPGDVVAIAWWTGIFQSFGRVVLFCGWNTTCAPLATQARVVEAKRNAS